MCVRVCVVVVMVMVSDQDEGWGWKGGGRGLSYLMPLDGEPLQCARCDRHTSAPSIPFCSYRCTR